ncbi:MAG: hypothetical protein AAFR42_03670 [Cyanobacteria bacterium J06628_6]
MALTRLRPVAAALLIATTLIACSKEEAAVVDPTGDEAAAETTAAAEETTAAAPDVSPNAGEVKAGTYSNEYFGFSMDFPTEWAVASDETAEELQDMGSDIVAGDDEALKASIEAAEQNTYQLLMVSEQPVGAPVATFNPNIVVMAEKVSHLPGIASGAEYLANVSNLLTSTDLPYEAAGEPYEVEIGGRTFHRADFSLSAAGMEINQSYLALVDNGYALGFILSGTDESMGQLEEITDSLTF